MIFMNRWILTNLNEMVIDEIHCFRPRERPKPAWKPWWPWWIQTFLGPNWNSGTVVLSTMCNMCITCRSPCRSPRRSPRRIMSRFVACSSRVEYFGVLWRRWQMESCKWCLWSSQMVCAGMVCFCANSLCVPRAAMAASTCMEASKTGYTDADVYRGIEKAPKTLRGSSGSLHIRKLYIQKWKENKRFVFVC